MQKFPGGACPQTPLEIVCLCTWKMPLPSPLAYLLTVPPPPLGNFLNEGLLHVYVAIAHIVTRTIVAALHFLFHTYLLFNGMDTFPFK